MKRKIHVAAAQLVSAGGSVETLPRIAALSHAASLLGADAILFSEVAVHGYDYDMTPDSVRRLAEPVDGPTATELLAVARRTNVVVLAGMFELEGELVYNSHLIAEPSGRLSVQRKHALTAGEKQAGLTPGPRERLVFEIKGVRCAVLICADTGIAEMADELRARQVQVRFIPTGGGGKLSETLSQDDLETPEGRRRYEENRPRVCMADAFDPKFDAWGCAFVAANALGPAGVQTCHQGHCMIVDGQGVLRAQAVGTIVREHMHEQIINAVLSFK